MILCRRFSTCRHFSLSVSLKLDQVSLINVSSWCCPPLFCLLQVSWPLTFWASRWWERTSVASARSRRRNSVSAGRSWELFIPSLATTTPSTWGWDLNVAAPVSPMSRNSLHCSTNWSYTIFTLFKFAASGPDSFQPSGSYSHETGSAAALLSLPSPLHSLPSRTRTRTHCRAADHVWVSNPACFYLDLICFFLAALEGSLTYFLYVGSQKISKPMGSTSSSCGGRVYWWHQCWILEWTMWKVTSQRVCGMTTTRWDLLPTFSPVHTQITEI